MPWLIKVSSLPLIPLITVWLDKSYSPWKMLMIWKCRLQAAVRPDKGSQLVQRFLPTLEERKQESLSVLNKSNPLFLFSRNLLPLSSHMIHLCSRVSHRSSVQLPQSPSLSLFVGHRSTSTLLVESKRRITVQDLGQIIKNSSLVLIPLSHTYTVFLNLFHQSPLLWNQALNSGHDRLPCYLVIFIPQQASKMQWRLNAAKAPMKPATVQEEFIPFQQLMNICSALVALRSVVLWVQRRSQLIMSNPQVLQCFCSETGRGNKNKFPVCIMCSPRPMNEACHRF